MQHLIDFHDLYYSIVEKCRLLRGGNEVVGAFCLSLVLFILIIANSPKMIEMH
jgi:hypothetical protein